MSGLLRLASPRSSLFHSFTRELSDQLAVLRFAIQRSTKQLTESGSQRAAFASFFIFVVAVRRRCRRSCHYRTARETSSPRRLIPVLLSRRSRHPARLPGTPSRAPPAAASALGAAVVFLTVCLQTLSIAENWCPHPLLRSWRVLVTASTKVADRRRPQAGAHGIASPCSPSRSGAAEGASPPLPTAPAAAVQP